MRTCVVAAVHHCVGRSFDSFSDVEVFGCPILFLIIEEIDTEGVPARSQLLYWEGSYLSLSIKSST